MSNKAQQLNNSNYGAFVYVAEFDNGVAVRDVLPPIRNEAIAEANDPTLKRQRYCVWRLLDYALKKTIGKGVAELTFVKNEYGKWSCDGAYFSLSHSERVVAVAVSVVPVGVDIEFIEQTNFNSRLAERILNERELAIYNNVVPEEQQCALARFWTKKEAVFKREGGAHFTPSAIDTLQNDIYSQHLQLTSGEFCLAASTANNLPVKLCKIANFIW